MADINIFGTLKSVAEDQTIARYAQIDCDGTKLNVVLSNKEDKPTTKTSLDNPVQVNTIYNLGTLSSDVTITLPSTLTDSQTGQLIYISYTNTTYSITITGGTLLSQPIFLQNCFSELMFMYMGSNTWSVAYRGVLQ